MKLNVMHCCEGRTFWYRVLNQRNTNYADTQVLIQPQMPRLKIWVPDVMKMKMVMVMKTIKMLLMMMMMILVDGRRKVNDLCGPTMKYWQVLSSSYSLSSSTLSSSSPSSSSYNDNKDDKKHDDDDDDEEEEEDGDYSDDDVVNQDQPLCAVHILCQMPNLIVSLSY